MYIICIFNERIKLTMKPGVYTATHNDNSIYYRVSISYRGKHISLGSFDDEDTASAVYNEARLILNDHNAYYMDTAKCISAYPACTSAISHDKFISLINFRDNNIYIKTPIYLCSKYFLYFLTEKTVFTFDTDDLFYYSNHKIMSRGGHYFVNDYGVQTGILSRYGIRPYAVAGRDYIFKNNNAHDLRYNNIEIINKYAGVSVFQNKKNGRTQYKARIHINGDYIIGIYNSETEAAIAYNKAIDTLSGRVNIAFTPNYIEDISAIEYAAIYSRLRISKKLFEI